MQCIKIWGQKGKEKRQNKGQGTGDLPNHPINQEPPTPQTNGCRATGTQKA